MLTPSQAHALSRSAPLTPAQFKALRMTEEQRVPVRALAGVLRREQPAEEAPRA